MRRHRRALDIAGFVALAALALVLWPQRWGGSMTYDLTHGTSMQPSFHTGDLAVLRTSDSYDVGDVAAYRSPSLHTTVMHRIKTKTPAGYTFQGDNNDFVDPDTVTDEQMLGRLLFRVPGVGRYLDWLLKPINLVLAAGALFLLLSDRTERSKQAAAPPAGHALVPAGPPPPSEAPPLVVRVKALRLPHELPTAEVESEEDLRRVAQLHGLAVLRTPEADHVLQDGLLWTYQRADDGRGHLRRPNPHGRDWGYPQPSPDVISLTSRRVVS